jgi:hypothetical protein
VLYYYIHQNDTWSTKLLVSCVPLRLPVNFFSIVRSHTQVAAVMTFDTIHQILISHTGMSTPLYACLGKCLWNRERHYVAIPNMAVWLRLARLAPDVPDGCTFADDQNKHNKNLPCSNSWFTLGRRGKEVGMMVFKQMPREYLPTHSSQRALTRDVVAALKKRCTRRE